MKKLTITTAVLSAVFLALLMFANIQQTSSNSGANLLGSVWSALLGSDDGWISRFEPGTYVEATRRFNVYSEPDDNSEQVGYHLDGEGGTIEPYTPVRRWSYAWVYVNFDDGADGWVNDKYLAEATNPAPEPVDTDGDGVPDESDNCPNDSNSGQRDTDGDGIGDECDPVDNSVPDPEPTPTPDPGDTTSGEWISRFPAGSRVETTRRMNVFSDSSASNGVGYQLESAAGTVGTQTPVEKYQYAYIYVNFDSGVDGWVDDKYLTALEGSGADTTSDPDPVVDPAPTPDPVPVDTDGDGVADTADNCPNTSNANQADFDKDGQGDACDTDDDNDGILDTDETSGCALNPDTNCGVVTPDPTPTPDPVTSQFNPGDTVYTTDNLNVRTQPNGSIVGVADVGSEGAVAANDPVEAVGYIWIYVNFINGLKGWVADQFLSLVDPKPAPTDTDGDGVADTADNCPNTSNADQANFDGDGNGDACDTDDDNDGILDVNETSGCVLDPDPACGTTTPTPAPTPVPGTDGDINVDASKTFQTFQYWEVMGEAFADNSAFPLFKDEVMQNAADAGFNRVRLEVRSGAENTKANWVNYHNGTLDYDTWRCVRYSVVNDDSNPNNVKSSGFHFEEMDWNIDNVVLPLKQKLAAKGESLYVNLNYVNFTGQMTKSTCASGLPYDHYNNPDEYAEFMTAAVDHMKSKYGFVPDGIEIMLEPDYGKGNFPWDQKTLAQAIVALDTRLKAAGYDIDMIAPSNTNLDHVPGWLANFEKVPGAMDAIDEISYHRYNTVSQTALQDTLNYANKYGAGISMLEFWNKNNTPSTLMEDLKRGNNTAWQLGTVAGDDAGNGYVTTSRVDVTNPSNPIVTINQRSAEIQQFMRFIKKGALRIDTTSKKSALDPVSFVNKDGKYVVVVVATGSNTFTVGHLPAGTYGVMYTTSSVQNKSLSDVTISSGQVLQTSIPAAGVITIYQK